MENDHSHSLELLLPSTLNNKTFFIAASYLSTASILYNMKYSQNSFLDSSREYTFDRAEEVASRKAMRCQSFSSQYMMLNLAKDDISCVLHLSTAQLHQQHSTAANITQQSSQSLSLTGLLVTECLVAL